MLLNNQHLFYGCCFISSICADYSASREIHDDFGCCLAQQKNQLMNIQPYDL